MKDLFEMELKWPVDIPKLRYKDVFGTTKHCGINH